MRWLQGTSCHSVFSTWGLQTDQSHQFSFYSFGNWPERSGTNEIHVNDMCFSLGSFQNAEVVETVEENSQGKEKSSDTFRKVRNRTAFPSTREPKEGSEQRSEKQMPPKSPCYVLLRTTPPKEGLWSNRCRQVPT